MYAKISKKTLSKGVFFTVLLLMILYVSGFSVGTQNSIAFTAIIFSPLGFYYLKSVTYKLIFSLVIVYLLLLNGSRSGAIISIVQAILVFFSAVPRLRRYMKALIIGAFLFSFLAFSDELMEGLGGVVYPYNQELGELLINTNYVLNNDLSWLQRKAQVQKAKQIFEEHPILGVGFSNFPSYDIRIDELAVGGDIALKGIENRSAHNSYFEVLAETGLIGFVLFCVFFIGVLLTFWRNLNSIVSEFEVCIFVSLIGMLIYFYSISAYLGTSSWIMYSLYAAGSHKARNIKSLI
jgi:O-antigen ligase